MFKHPDRPEVREIFKGFRMVEGTCRQALDAMAAAWEVPRPVWASLPDGPIYWGDWADSPFNQQDPVAMDPHLVIERDP